MLINVLRFRGVTDAAKTSLEDARSSPGNTRNFCPQFARIPSESTCFWMFRDAVELSKNRVIPRILPLDAAIKNAHFWIRVPPGTFGDIDVPKGTHDC